MRRKSNWDKGYDFEEGRQARKHEEDLSAKPFGVEIPKPSKPSRSSGSSGGGGFGGSGIAGIGVGGVIFLFFVLLCLFSMAGDVIDSLDQSDEIAQMELEDAKYAIKQWATETNLVDEFSSDGNYHGWHIFRFGYFAIKGDNVCVSVEIFLYGSDPDTGDKSIGLILHSVDSGNSCEVVWRSDKNECPEIRSRPKNIEIVSENEIRISFWGGRTNMYTDDLKKIELYTLDGGNTWNIRRTY